LEQCNGSSALDTKHWGVMAVEEGWCCLFHWGAFGIKGIVGDKIVSTSFGGAAGHGEWVPGAGVLAAQPLREADPSATWRLGGSSTQGRL